MKRARTVALRAWLVGTVYQVMLGGPLLREWERFGRDVTEGALIALVPTTLVFWVLWLPLCAFLTRRADLRRRRYPLTLAAVALFGGCGWIAQQFAPPYSGALLGSWHFPVLYGLVGLVAGTSQNPQETIETADYALPAFWISVATAVLAAVGTGFALVLISADEHNVTTGMSSGAVGLVWLIVALPFLVLSTLAALLLWRARRESADRA